MIIRLSYIDSTLAKDENKSCQQEYLSPLQFTNHFRERQ